MGQPMLRSRAYRLARLEKNIYARVRVSSDNMAEEKSTTKKVEDGAEKTGEVVGKGIKAGIGGIKGLGKGIKEGVKKDEEK
jgi:biotin synthase-like enzyme